MNARFLLLYLFFSVFADVRSRLCNTFGLMLRSHMEFEMNLRSLNILALEAKSELRSFFLVHAEGKKLTQ